MIRNTSNHGRVIEPIGLKPRPRKHELVAAETLARHLKTDILFISTTLRPTPDFLINGLLWELKSPQGKGKNNIQRQLQYANRQSENVIIDASRSKIHGNKIKREVVHQFKMTKSVKRLIFISKAGEVFTINR